jgi:hypothetical protein
MRIEHVPQDRFIANSLVRMIAASDDQDVAARSYNTTIGCGVDELVKQNMRHLSQQGVSVRGWEALLDMAVERSAGMLRHELDSHLLAFDLGPYLQHAKESLKEAAKEMDGLKRKLMDSREKRRIGEKTPVSTVGARRHYEVLELGLLDSIDGLLATPTADVGGLNLDGIRQAFAIEGEWFPFEVQVDGFLFVIDDDGALYISTENFPKELLERARAVLHRLAETLYL